jgi:hypothetical protein
MKASTTLLPWALSIAALLLAASACSAPVRDLDAEAIESLTDLDELMDVNATVADPRFKLAKSLADRTPTESEWAEFIDMGTRLQVTARHAKRFSMGEGFDGFLRQLEGQAKSLEDAARARDKRATVDLAAAIKGTCKACHDEYK